MNHRGRNNRQSYYGYPYYNLQSPYCGLEASNQYMPVTGIQPNNDFFFDGQQMVSVTPSLHSGVVGQPRIVHSSVVQQPYQAVPFQQAISYGSQAPFTINGTPTISSPLHMQEYQQSFNQQLHQQSPICSTPYNQQTLMMQYSVPTNKMETNVYDPRFSEDRVSGCRLDYWQQNPPQELPQMNKEVVRQPSFYGPYQPLGSSLNPNADEYTPNNKFHWTRNMEENALTKLWNLKSPKSSLAKSSHTNMKVFQFDKQVKKQTHKIRETEDELVVKDDISFSSLENLIEATIMPSKKSVIDLEDYESSSEKLCVADSSLTASTDVADVVSDGRSGITLDATPKGIVDIFRMENEVKNTPMVDEVSLSQAALTPWPTSLSPLKRNEQMDYLSVYKPEYEVPEFKFHYPVLQKAPEALDLEDTLVGMFETPEMSMTRLSVQEVHNSATALLVTNQNESIDRVSAPLVELPSISDQISQPRGAESKELFDRLAASCGGKHICPTITKNAPKDKAASSSQKISSTKEGHLSISSLASTDSSKNDVYSHSDFSTYEGAVLPLITESNEDDTPWQMVSNRRKHRQHAMKACTSHTQQSIGKHNKHILQDGQQDKKSRKACKKRRKRKRKSKKNLLVPTITHNQVKEEANIKQGESICSYLKESLFRALSFNLWWKDKTS